MSFFDEADEPLAEPRTAPRRRRPSGTGGRPPSDQQSILVRRVVAVVAIIVVLVLIVVGVHSCQVSARNTSLKDYANNISNLNQESVSSVGNAVFRALTAPGATSNPQALQTSLTESAVTANMQLSRAKGLDVPDEMKTAQQQFVLTMAMRHDGVADIAASIQRALGKTTNKDAINEIATDMARFYSSDLIYKEYATHQVVNALHNAGLAVGAPNGVQLDGSQFLPDIAWLSPTGIAAKLGSSLPSSSGGTIKPGTHGHSLDSVSVGGTTLQTGSTNTIPRSPPPQFTLSFTNGGQNTENNVVCKVSVSSTKISGQTVVPQTTPGESTTCKVTLTSSPPAGNDTVTATIQPVPGEKNASNNTLTFPVTFQ